MGSTPTGGTTWELSNYVSCSNKKIVRRYARTLKQARYPVAALYLFGSSATGRPHRWSDIDVAVISDKLKRQWNKNSWRLWQLRMGVDTRIEPHGFTVKEFSDISNPLVYEIKRSGVRVI